MNAFRTALMTSRKIDFFLLHFGQFADVMFLARNRNEGRYGQGDTGRANGESHNAPGQ